MTYGAASKSISIPAIVRACQYVVPKIRRNTALGGRCGFRAHRLVIRHYKNALKIPRVYRNPHALLEEREIEDITKEQNITFLENEKEVYL